MAKIELLLGWPTTPEREEQIEELIYDLNVCRETALNIRVKIMIDWFAQKNYINRVATVEAGQPVKLPRIGFGVYKHNGFLLPKMVIHGFYMTESDTSGARLIDKHIINAIGVDIESVFEIEYWGFKRTGRVALSRADVIYQFRGRPHIYVAGEFLEACQ